jgi:hypothetical protein
LVLAPDKAAIFLLQQGIPPAQDCPWIESCQALFERIQACPLKPEVMLQRYGCLALQTVNPLPVRTQA